MPSKAEADFLRINMIAAWCNRKLLAPFTIEGTCNQVVFETWLETCLVPVLQPGQVVIVDNATFHKGGCIEQLIRAAGAHKRVFTALLPRPQ